MKIKLNKIIGCLALVALMLGSSISVVAADYVAVAKNGNVYDEASAKYITVNQDNEDVAVIPGMVFPTSEHTPGWYKVEYSPGLHAFIPDQITATNLKPLAPGTFEIVNMPGHQLTAQKDGDSWVAIVEGNSFKGEKFQEIVVFLDKTNRQAYSLVDLGNGPIAISYDNAVTKFF